MVFEILQTIKIAFLTLDTCVAHSFVLFTVRPYWTKSITKILQQKNN